MSEVLFSKDDKVRSYNGYPKIALSKDIARMTNLRVKEPIKLAVVRGKHGIFAAQWNRRNQPEPSDIQSIIKETVEGGEDDDNDGTEKS